MPTSVSVQGGGRAAQTRKRSEGSDGFNQVRYMVKQPSCRSATSLGIGDIIVLLFIDYLHGLATTGLRTHHSSAALLHFGPPAPMSPSPTDRHCHWR